MRRPVVLAIVAALALTVLGGCRAAGTRTAAAPAAEATPTASSPDGQATTASPAAGASSLMTSHAPSATPTTVEPIAPAPGGLSIADVWAQRKALAGKDVTVRGKVVKVNNQILERNWIHLQDGSGSAADRTNDLTVTTDAYVKVGDTITITGVLAIGKEFGAGYGYDAILESGKIVR